MEDATLRLSWPLPWLVMVNVVDLLLPGSMFESRALAAEMLAPLDWPTMIRRSAWHLMGPLFPSFPTI